MPPDYTGEILDGRYSVVRLLGRGGMGAVYLGRHVKINRRIAIKFLHGAFTTDPDLVKRFYREARAAASVEHSNIIDIIDVGVSDRGDPYFVMEYLEGEPLKNMLTRRGPMDSAAACGILEPILTALDAIHERGLIHRDLKPDNIFLVHEKEKPPRVKLIDFGISKFIESTDETHLTQTGALLGTPAYMAPEQVRGDKDIDHRADLYSIGVVFYEMLTGRLPFSGPRTNVLLVNILTDEPEPPSNAFPDFPIEAEPLIMKLLSREPSDRPPNASSVLEEMKTLPGFEQRESKLTLAASGLVDKRFAGDEPGTPSNDVESSSDLAEAVLSEVAGTPPNAWSTTLKPRLPKRMKTISIGTLLAVIFIGLSLAWQHETQSNVQSSSRSMPTPPAIAEPPIPSPQRSQHIAPPVPPSTPPSEKVKIEIRDLPENASIYYNNALVWPKTSTFFVKQETVLVKLEIKAPGYESKALNIVPSGDMVIHGKLTRIKKKQRNPPGPKNSSAPIRKKEFDDAFE